MKKVALFLSLVLTVLCYFSANAELIKAQPKAEKPVEHSAAPLAIVTAQPVSVKVHHAKHHKHRRHHKHHRKHKSAALPLPTAP